MEKVLKRKEAAEYLGIGLSVLDQARSCGEITYIQYAENGCIYFTKEALREYVARSTHRAGPRPTIPTYRKVRRPTRW
jgi:hypothetical protein